MSGHSLFGLIAIKLGFVNEDEIKAALEEQDRLQQAGVNRLLGEILQERGLAGEADIARVVEVQNSLNIAMDDTLFGELAINNGFVQPDLVERALKRQRENEFTQRLGEILVEQGHLELKSREALLSTQARLRERL